MMPVTPTTSTALSIPVRATWTEAVMEAPAPPAAPVAYGLFAHCFSCGKDVRAASRISRGLARHGIAVLRFDFTGADTPAVQPRLPGPAAGSRSVNTFSCHVDDIRAAAASVSSLSHGTGPQLLIGHSWGGTAVLAAAATLGTVRAVATIGAPCDPHHVLGLLSAVDPAAGHDAQVRLGERVLTLHPDFVRDLSRQPGCTARLSSALLVMHALRDTVVPLEEATRIFHAARHPKSFVALPEADHLLSRPGDGDYVADVIAAWARAYFV